MTDLRRNLNYMPTRIYISPTDPNSLPLFNKFLFSSISTKKVTWNWKKKNSCWSFVWNLTPGQHPDNWWDVKLFTTSASRKGHSSKCHPLCWLDYCANISFEDHPLIKMCISSIYVLFNRCNLSQYKEKKIDFYYLFIFIFLGCR